MFTDYSPAIHLTMKSITIMRSLVALLLVVLVSSFTSNPPAKRFSPVGTWDYTIEGVPEEYESGSMIISEKDKAYEISMALNEYYTIEGESIEYKKKKLNFIIWVESEEVSISGSFDGDTFSGLVSLSQGDFDMVGERKTE